MPLTGQHWIDGEWSADQPDTFAAKNAATRERLTPSFAEATDREVDSALVSADKAFEVLQTVPREQIAELLDAIAHGLESAAALFERAQAETALPLPRLQMECGRTVGQTRRFAKIVRAGSWVQARIDRGDPERQPIPKPDVRTMLTAVGPVAVFGASNFPLAISVAGTDTISAFAARCPVVVKGHPGHPGTCELLAEVIAKAIAKTGLPAGMFSLLQGAGHEVGLALVRHPLTRVAAFTGSLQGGRALFDAAATRPNPIPVYAEMGSTNPVFVLPQALKNRASQIAHGYVQSVTLGVGQFCTNPGLLLVPNSAGADQFIDAVRREAEAVAPASMLHEGILAQYRAGVARLAAIEGVEEITQSPADNGHTADCVMFVSDAALLQKNPTLAEEVFGPASIVLKCDSVDQMYDIARHLEGHLTATIHGEENELIAHANLIRLLQRRVGRLVFDGYPTGIEVCAAMHHGGPYPATTHSGVTSIGEAAILRFAKPTCYQDLPDIALPEELRNHNGVGIWRLIDGEITRADAGS